MKRAFGVALLVVMGGSLAPGFGGENLLSTKWRDWHHNTLSRFAAQQAGFVRKLANETESEDPDSPAGEVAWHADFIDSYAYNPLYWVLGGTSRIACSAGIHDELVKLHFDDLSSVPQVRYQYFQYTTGALQGLLYAKSLYESGRTPEAIALGRQVLGVTLHAIQDFYSHSNWIDHPDRRQTTWFSKFTANTAELAQTPIFTGTYETPAHLGAKPHGVMSPVMSALMQIAPIMDALSSEISPVREMPIMDMWRRNRGNTQAIQPGVFPDGNVSTMTDGLLAPPSQTFVGIPPNMLYVAPPGIALDATYLRNIAVQQRGLIDINGDTAFKLAYQRAYDASLQFLQRIGSTMSQISNGTAFWEALKTYPVTNKHTQTFEDFTQQAYQFVSAGKYPIPSSQAQGLLPLPTSIPPKQYFLRVRLKTSPDAFSGSDADIRLTANGQEYLLDVSPTHGQDNLHAIIMYNDFEAGLNTNYLVGPFASMPSQIELKNDSADAGYVLKTFFEDFGTAVLSFFQSIGNFLSNLFGAQADFVGQNRVVYQPIDLKNLTSNWHYFNIGVDGGAEGRYTVNCQIRKFGTTDLEDVYHVRIPTMVCNKESTIDQLKIGLGGDEPFLMAALAPLPGDVLKNRTMVFKWAHDNHVAKLQTPVGAQTNEFQANRTGAYYFDWQMVRVPKNHGMLALAVCVMESDDETNLDRDNMLNQFAGQLDSKTKPVRENFRSALGRAVAADWKLEGIEVYGFSKGGGIEAGTVLKSQPNLWIEGGKRVPFALNLSAMKSYPIDVSSLQKTILQKTITGVGSKIPNVTPGTLRPGTGAARINPGGNATPVTPPGTANPGTTVPGGVGTRTPPATTGGGPVKVIPGGPGRPGVAIPNRTPGTTTPGITVPGGPAGGSKVLLVDDDRSPNNEAPPANPTPSKGDAFYGSLLAAARLPADVFVAPSNGVGPDVAKLGGYSFVLWYTSDQQGNGRDAGDLSAADKANLQAWLSAGTGKTLVLVSPGLAQSLIGAPTLRRGATLTPTSPTDAFLNAVLGSTVAGGIVARGIDGSVRNTAGTVLPVSKDSLVPLIVGALTPGTGTPLFTWIPATGGGATPIVGTMNRVGGNKVIYLGFPLENCGPGATAIFQQCLAISRAP